MTLALALALPAASLAQEGGPDRVTGRWTGTLDTPTGPLTLVVEVRGAGDGLAGTLSVPDRGLADLPLTAVALEADGTFRFRFPADAASYEGTLEGRGAEARISGTWSQRGQEVPLELEPVDEEGGPDTVARAQTPTPPFPYVVEDIVLDAGVTLACTLTAPRGPDDGTRPAAVLLSVAGPNDRDMSHFGHRPFMVLADHLTRRGMEVLRCDDRGVGDSEGDLYEATFEDFATDALAGVRYLQARPGVDAGAVGIVGISEGTVVGPRAAATSDDIAFLVLLGAAAVPGDELIGARRRATVADREGAGAAEVDDAMAVWDDFVGLVTQVGGVGIDEARRVRPGAVDSLRTLVGSPRIGSDPLLPPDPEAQLRLFLSPWYHAQLTGDGGRWLRQVRNAPVLALTGSLDRVNLPEQNLPAVRAALEEAGNPDATTALLPGLNHVMQEARTGAMAEYGRLESTFAPLALETISHWIGLRFGPDAVTRGR